jgi:uncharacterized membrane protein
MARKQSNDSRPVDATSDLSHFFTADRFTGYGAAVVINQVLEEAGLKKIPSTMIYSYVKKGYIPSIKSHGKVMIEKAAVIEWLVQYITKKTQTEK